VACPSGTPGWPVVLLVIGSVYALASVSAATPTVFARSENLPITQSLSTVVIPASGTLALASGQEGRNR
jgi:hypothetical protein